MARRPKDQGTEEETRQVRRLHAAGYPDAERLSEGGANDISDLRFTHPAFGPFYIESKWRERWNIFNGLRQARAKLTKAGVDKDAPLVAWWKQTVKTKDTNVRRSQVYKPVVIMDEDLFVRLLRLAGYYPPYGGVKYPVESERAFYG